MEWERDVSAGDWLVERVDDPWRGTMHDVVPRGFEAYARVFHPASVSFVSGERMPPPAEYRELPWPAQEALGARLEHGPLTWAAAAGVFGTTFHAEAQWNRIVRTPDDASDWQQVGGPDGRWYDAPTEGELAADAVAVLAGILARHTTTPGDGFVTLWEGSGRIVGHLGHGPSYAVLQAGDPGDESLARHNDMLTSAMHDPFNRVFSQATWQEGALSREISEGPRLRLPARDHVLFRGGVAELAAPNWFLDVPWRDRPLEALDLPPDAHSPSIVWPADRAWVWITEVDYDSTIVGGTNDAIRALCADDRLEALPIREGAMLTYDSDDLNR